MKNLKTKKAQQETVGFVLIIMIVLIVGVIFLGISLRNKQQPVFTADAELSNFLSSTLRYTSECVKDHDSDFKTLEELASYCYSQQPLNCPSQRTPCEVLEDTYTDMIQVYKPAGLVRYAKLSFSFNDTLSQTEFLNVTIGNQTSCQNTRAAKQDIDKGTGRISVELNVCLTSLEG